MNKTIALVFWEPILGVPCVSSKMCQPIDVAIDVVHVLCFRGPRKNTAKKWETHLGDSFTFQVIFMVHLWKRYLKAPQYHSAPS